MKTIATMLLAVSLVPLYSNAEEYELIPPEQEKPLVFASEPNEFAGTPDARSFSFNVDAAKLFGDATFDQNTGVQIRIRATQPDTKAVEFSLHQAGGKSWGLSSLPIDSEWQDIVLPLPFLRYFSHWKGMPPVEEDEIPDLKLLDNVRFCFGKWLCPKTLDKPHGFEVASFKIIRLAPGAFGDGNDHSLDEFPRQEGEEDDTARLRRAINSTPEGVLTIPRGTYTVSSTIYITNHCSFELNKNAVIRAIKPMPVVLSLSNGLYRRKHDYNLFFRGGVIDGNGLASCILVNGFAHFTMANSTFLNGKEYGLRVDGGYELIANNLYFKCVMPGLAGNSAVYVNGGDSHYTDCIVVDYTIGFNLVSGGSNRLTRCHVWGGPIPPPAPGELPEMLKGSINYKISCSSAILRDCYADTGEIGYLVDGWDTRLLGCSYFNNKHFGLDNITIIKHNRGRLLVSDGGFVKTTPHVTVYDGCGTVEWFNMMYSGFTSEDNCPGALKFQKKDATDQPALKLAD